MSCGCNQIENPCQPTEPCLCKVRLNSDCITVSGATNLCLGIDDNLILTDYLSQLDDKICEKIATLTNFIALKGVGTGAQVYKGIDVLGKKEIRSLKSLKPELIIAQTIDEITFDLNIPSVTPPDGSETKLQSGTNTTVSGNGTTTTPYAVNVTFPIPPVIDGSETKVVNGLNTIANGNGTVATPYYIDVSVPTINQDNFVRTITINEFDLPGGITEQNICDYILALPTNQRTILETDSKWNVVIVENVS
jgi:hypothetical protein